MYLKSYIYSSAVFVSTCKAPELISDVLMSVVCQNAWQLYAFKRAVFVGEKICMGDERGGSEGCASCWDKEK